MLFNHALLTERQSPEPTSGGACRPGQRYTVSLGNPVITSRSQSHEIPEQERIKPARSFWHKHRRIASLAAAPWIGRAAATANDRIGIGLIGVGGRGSDHRDELIRLATSQNVQITAVCDVWRKASQATAEKVTQKLGHEPRQFTRFGELLEQRDVDAVVIATPDFSHGTILTAALKAGKDVYVEKPMTIDLASAREALELARAGSRIVQAGTQRRSDGHFRAAAKHIATGELGHDQPRLRGRGLQRTAVEAGNRRPRRGRRRLARVSAPPSGSPV